VTYFATYFLFFFFLLGLLFDLRERSNILLRNFKLQNKKKIQNPRDRDHRSDLLKWEAIPAYIRGIRVRLPANESDFSFSLMAMGLSSPSLQQAMEAHGFMRRRGSYIIYTIG
jgi:hypothetical protein